MDFIVNFKGLSMAKIDYKISKIGLKSRNYDVFEQNLAPWDPRRELRPMETVSGH